MKIPFWWPWWRPCCYFCCSPRVGCPTATERQFGPFLSVLGVYTMKDTVSCIVAALLFILFWVALLSIPVMSGVIIGW